MGQTSSSSVLAAAVAAAAAAAIVKARPAVFPRIYIQVRLASIIIYD
jgi:hypothetical protein